ncbi:hypothetical protein KC353_g21993, partial [Hortaea werneckii]
MPKVLRFAACFLLVATTITTGQPDEAVTGPPIGTTSETPLPGPGISSSETTTVPSGWVDQDHNTPSKSPPAADPSADTDNAVDVRKGSEPETDSPLDNANFLSFEEWKKQNLAKAGQSSEHLVRARQPSSDRQRPGINNVLDTLGDEGEIDIDFAGFGSPRPSETQQASTQEAELSSDGLSTPPNNVLRSKDAGKTCKE